MSERFEAAPAEPKRLPIIAVWLERVLTVIAGLILLFTMTMTAVDVFGRYVFNHPLGFAYELTELVMAVLFFVALPVVTLRGEHISVGLFDHLFTGRMAAFRDLVVALFILVGVSFLCWRMVLFADRFARYGEHTNVLKIPIYPVALIGAVGLGFAAIAGVFLTIEAARRLARGSA